MSDVPATSLTVVGHAPNGRTIQTLSRPPSVMPPRTIAVHKTNSASSSMATQRPRRPTRWSTLHRPPQPVMEPPIRH